MQRRSWVHLSTLVVAVLALGGGPLVSAAVPCRCDAGAAPPADRVADDAPRSCCSHGHAPQPADTPAPGSDEAPAGPCDSPIGCPALCCATKVPATVATDGLTVWSGVLVDVVVERANGLPVAPPLDGLLRPPRS